MEKEEIVKAFNLKSDKKKKKENPAKKNYFFVGGLLILVIIILLISMTYYQRCDSLECFNKNLENCRRTIFAGGTNMVFGYVIEGSSKDICVVNVELLQGELNNKDSLLLEGKSMKCFLPKGVIMMPESDLKNCHGELKEQLQELVIKQLHGYLVKNLGQINGDILDPLRLLEGEVD